ncbi:MAG: Hsp20/alpha crystallin family protein [Methanotrichaceae archaeon]|nr:Hsp20/alpha crystallin family protein [Methanotrichaceae archaeon]
MRERYPTSRVVRREDEWFRGMLGNMMRMFEELPEEVERMGREAEATAGARKRIGPFVYGFSFSAEPGKEPVFSEFGNIRPSLRGVRSVEGRSPVIDKSEDEVFFRIVVELPGVEKQDIKLVVDQESFRLETTGDLKFATHTYLDEPVKPETARAQYRNGLLHLTIEKKEARTAKEWKGTTVAIE